MMMMMMNIIIMIIIIIVLQSFKNMIGKMSKGETKGSMHRYFVLS